MKIIVTDKGDPSVGIFPQSFDIDCPFDENTDKETKEFFRENIKKLYAEFSEGKILVEYDYELKYKDSDFE